MGVAPRAKLLAIRAFASEGGRIGADGTTDHIVRGIEWAHQRGARVVNMSFTGPRDPLLSRELRAGKEKGIVFVAAANEGPNAAAADDSVIAVTASDAQTTLSSCQQGPRATQLQVDVMVVVLGTYEFRSGIDGRRACERRYRPCCSRARSEPNPCTISLSCARRLSTETGADGNCGIGVVDALAWSLSQAKTRSGVGRLLNSSSRWRRTFDSRDQSDSIAFDISARSGERLVGKYRQLARIHKRSGRAKVRCLAGLLWPQTAVARRILAFRELITSDSRETGWISGKPVSKQHFEIVNKGTDHRGPR
jgi:subtilisin family serine protease